MAKETGWFIEDKDGFIEQVFPHIHPPQEGAFKLYTAPQLSDAEAKFKIAIEALQGLITSVIGYRKNIQDNQPCDAEVFAKQALEKIGE